MQRSALKILTLVLSSGYTLVAISRINKICLEIAKNAKIPGCDDPKSDKLASVRDWVDSPESDKWMLFLDSADDFDLLFGYRNLVKSLPRSNSSAILFRISMYERNTQTLVDIKCDVLVSKVKANRFITDFQHESSNF